MGCKHLKHAHLAGGLLVLLAVCRLLHQRLQRELLCMEGGGAARPLAAPRRQAAQQVLCLIHSGPMALLRASPLRSSCSRPGEMHYNFKAGMLHEQFAPAAACRC